MLGDDCCGVALRVKAGCIAETGVPSTSMDEKGWKVKVNCPLLHWEVHLSV